MAFALALPFGPDLELDELLPAWVVRGRWVALPLGAFALTWILARIEIGISARGASGPADERVRPRVPIGAPLATLLAGYLLFGWTIGAGVEGFPPLLLALTATAVGVAVLLELRTRRRGARSAARRLAAAAAVLGLGAILGTGANLAARRLWERADDRAAVLLSLALFGPDAGKVADLGLIAHADGDRIGAERLLRAATRLDPDSPWWHADLAIVLVELGRCEEARIALAVAEDLATAWTGDVEELQGVLADARDAVAACVTR